MNTTKLKEILKYSPRFNNLKMDAVLDFVIENNLLIPQTVKDFIIERDDTTPKKLLKDYKGFEFLILNSFFKKPNTTRLFQSLASKKLITFNDVLQNGPSFMYEKWQSSLNTYDLNYDGDWKKKHSEIILQDKNEILISYKTFNNETDHLYDDLRGTHKGKGSLYAIKDYCDFIHLIDSGDKKDEITTIIENDFESHIDFYYLKKRVSII